jgi:hypothetical protein
MFPACMGVVGLSPAGGVGGGMRRIDNRRTDELQRAGFHVFRFTDEEVLTNIQGVAKEIGRIVKDITSPCPLQRGTTPPATPPAGDNSRQ